MSTAVQPVEQHEHAAADLPSPVKLTPRGYGHHEFMASLLPGVFERKVINLILETNAKLKKYSDDSVRLRLGNTLLFVRDKPVNEVKVEVSITIDRDTPCPDSMTRVVVDIRPRERVKKELFEKRCNHVVRAIHACFLGHHLQRLN
ncbi:MAG: hypothetical protein OES79_00930 [Planctomycetota bacterium]|nr:hypothetical protein [Planctomycetota bacterium]